MRKIALGRRMLAMTLFSAMGIFCGTALADGPALTVYTGITNPSEQRGLNFNVPGVVSKVTVKEGDEVKKGQEIAQQDDTVEQAELIVKEFEAATSLIQIEAAKADLAQKKVELARDQIMFQKHVLGQAELDKAALDVVIGELKIKLADQESQQKNLEAKAQRAKIAQKVLKSTIDGIVQKINVHEGELATNDPKTPCIQVVSNLPLYIEVDVSMVDARNLNLRKAAPGEKASDQTTMDVHYPEETQWQQASIIFLNPVANPAAGTQRVRLQLDNPRLIRSGQQIEVSQHTKAHFPGQAGVAGAQQGQ